MVWEGVQRGGGCLFFNCLCSLGSQAPVKFNIVSDGAIVWSHGKLKCEIGMGLDRWLEFQ